MGVTNSALPPVSRGIAVEPETLPRNWVVIGFMLVVHLLALVALLPRFWSPTAVVVLVLLWLGSPFSHLMFLLALFLLEMGLVASGRLSDLRRTGPFLAGFGIVVPLVVAVAALVAGGALCRGPAGTGARGAPVPDGDPAQPAGAGRLVVMAYGGDGRERGSRRQRRALVTASGMSSRCLDRRLITLH